MGKVGFHPPVSTAPTSEELNLLGSLFNAGHFVELESWSRSLLKLYPDSGVVWKLFGLSLQMQNKDALSALKKAADLLPNDAEAHGNLAAALRERGQLDAAVVSGMRAVQIRPDFAQAHNNLGVVLQDLGQLEDAVASYRSALLARPDFAEAHNNLGGALKELGLLEDAEASYRRALEIKPDFVKAHCNLGIVMRELGKFDREAECFRRALEIDPDCSEAMLGIGQMRMARGELPEAEGLFRRVLVTKPDDFEARYLLAQVGKAKASDENVTALLAAAEGARKGGTDIPYKKSIFLHFALGKSLDDIGDYDRAFPHFLEGCRLKRATFNYDAEQMSRHMCDITRIFDKATMDRLRGGGDSSTLPFFVLGMPRSGTTMTKLIMTGHPDVRGAGELPDLMTIANRDVDGTGSVFPYNIPALDAAGLTTWAQDYVAGLRRRIPQTKHITDKMPANFLAVGLIHMMLPNAKIIHVKRNPVDTCLSCFTQLFTNNQEHTYDLSELGKYYVDYARLMDHWRSVLPDDAFLDVQYEEVVADQETQARRIIEFCGLEWNDACLKFNLARRSIRTASAVQVRQPIYSSSIERWRPYEKFLGPLLNELGELVPKQKAYSI